MFSITCIIALSASFLTLHADDDLNQEKKIITEAIRHLDDEQLPEEADIEPLWRDIDASSPLHDVAIQVSRGRGLLAGHRQCHVATAAHELCDISPGPNASGAWTNCICVIADLITDDSTRLAELKSSFSEDAWRKCERHAANRLGQQHPCRDGRPNYSWIPLAWQPLAPFRVRGGYCQ